MNSNQGMPSILGDINPPFSTPQKPAGVGADFDSVFNDWQKQQTPENNTRLLKTVQPIIDTAVSSYAGQAAGPTIKSRAKLLALKALGSYDPQRGNVKTHLLSQLQRIRRLSAQTQNIISLPEQVGLDYQRLTEAENELRDQVGREPTDDELANFTNLSKRRIQKIHKFQQPLAEGTVSHIVDENSSGGDVASQVPGQTRAIDAWMDFVYDDLGPTDKLIMDLTLGRNGRRKVSTAEIAQKLRMTPGAISQRAAKIQAMLDKRHTQGGF